MNSRIYEGHVRHRRQTPVKNDFTYSIFLMYLDLAELPDLFRSRWLWSTQRTAVARFKRSDHLGDPGRPLDECVRELVEQHTGDRPAGPIRLLTHLRYFGYAMNPVSFYYCFHPDGKQLQFVVAEVNNTPWGEQHCYVIEQPIRQVTGGCKHVWQNKQFHVSPFMPMEMQYRWLLTSPTDRLAIHIENHDPTSRPFDVTMSLKQKSITSWNLSSVLLRYPFLTAKVAAAIYWQALRLWWKGCPFVPHPKTRSGSKSTVERLSESSTIRPAAQSDSRAAITLKAP